MDIASVFETIGNVLGYPAMLLSKWTSDFTVPTAAY